MDPSAKVHPSAQPGYGTMNDSSSDSDDSSKKKEAAPPVMQPYSGQPYGQPNPGQPFLPPNQGQPFQQPYPGQPMQQPYQGQPYQQTNLGQGFQQPYAGPPGQQFPGAQPSAPVQWMVRPDPINGIPPGLEYLASLDQVLVHQQVELLEVMTGIETKNRYAIKNSLGQQCYFAYEESDLLMRECCHNQRGFDMHIVDNNNQQVMLVHRDFRCCVGCCCCINGEYCANSIKVESPAGVPIGRIIQEWSSWKPRFAIEDAGGDVILLIRGPCCACSGPCCVADVPFDIYTPGEKECIGAIARQFSGLVKEMYTNATNFGLTFPVDLDIKAKALLLAATFLIDMMYFENQSNNNND